MDDEFIYGLNTCKLNIDNTKSESDTESDTESEYDDNNDNRLDEKIIIFNKKDGRKFNSDKLTPEEEQIIIFNKKDGRKLILKEEKAIVFNKDSSFFFKESEFVDIDLILKNRQNIIESRPSIGCNNNLFDTDNVTEYNIKDFNNNKINNTSYNKENFIKLKKEKKYDYPDRNFCNINVSGTWRKTNSINSSGTPVNTNSSGTYNDYNISELIAIDNDEGLEKIDFNFLNNILNIPNEEIFNVFDYKSIQNDIVLKDEMNAQSNVKEGFTNGGYNNKTILSITILLLLLIFICKNKILQVIVFILIIVFIIYSNKDNIEQFITTNKRPVPDWIRDPDAAPLINKTDLQKYVIKYKNYSYDFEKYFKKLKKFKKYNKYDYNTGIVFFNAFIRDLEIYNKIYCSNFSNYLNYAYMKLFIDTAFDYLKQSIKHFKYISLSIDNSSIDDNNILNNVFDVYPLEQQLYKILGDIYSIGFNIIYIIGRENNYILKFDRKYLNIFSNYIFLNGPASFMEETV